MESLCWTCARAYARPDPEGCGFHRKEHEHVFDKAKIEGRVNAAHEPMKVVMVTKCRYYDRESREPSSSQEMPTALTKRVPQVELRTHCHRGHEYTPDNTYITKRGHRECRKCRAESRRKHRMEGIG